MDKSWDIDGVNPILNPKVNLPSRDVFIEPIYCGIGGDLPLDLSHCHSTQYQMSVIDLSTYVYVTMDLCLICIRLQYRIAYIYQHPPYCMFELGYVHIYIYICQNHYWHKKTQICIHISLCKQKMWNYISLLFPLSLSVWLEVTVRTIYLPVDLPVYLPAYPCAYISLSLPMDLPCAYMNIISLYLFISQSTHPWDCTLNLSYVEMTKHVIRYIWIYLIQQILCRSAVAVSKNALSAILLVEKKRIPALNQRCPTFLDLL